MNRTIKNRLARLEAAAQPIFAPGHVVIIGPPDSDPWEIVCRHPPGGETYHRHTDETAEQFIDRVEKEATPTHGVKILVEVRA